MEIPSKFFGTLKEVKSKLKKLNTKLNKGESLQNLLEKDEKLDSENFPNSYYWVDKSWSMAGNSKHFILCEFLFSLCSDNRLSHDRINSIVDDNIEYLSSKPWGALMINASQGYAWCKYLPLVKGQKRKLGYISILKGYINFYTLFEKEGNRFFSGGNTGKSFNETMFLAGHVLANCKDEYNKQIVELATQYKMNQINKKIYEIITIENVIEKIQNEDWLNLSF